MTTVAPDGVRQRWARITGLMLVLTNATAMIAVSTRGGFVVRNDTAQTAGNILTDETMFRAALAFDLLTIAGVIPLVAGLYIVLNPVNRNLALLATLWRLIENAVLATLTVFSFTALTLLAGSDFIRSLAPGQVHDLGYALLRVHSWGFQVGFLFLGLGQLVFSCLWWKSRYVPRLLAGLGIVGSTVLAGMAVGIIVWPPLYGLVTMAYMAPMGLYEIGLGLWLAIRGIRLDGQRR
jgi:hypothetical protein